MWRRKPIGVRLTARRDDKAKPPVVHPFLNSVDMIDERLSVCDADWGFHVW